MEKTKTKTKTDFVNFQEIIEDNFKKSSEITQQTLNTLSKTYDEQTEILVDVNKKIVDTIQKEAKKPTPDTKEYMKMYETFKENIEKIYELSQTNITTLNSAIENQVNLAKETSEKFTKVQYNYDFSKYINEYQTNVEKANKMIMEQVTEIINNQKNVDMKPLFDMYQKNISEANQMITKNVTKVFDFYKRQYDMVTDLNKTYTDFVTNQVDTFTKLTRDTLANYWPTNWWKE